MEVQGFKGWRFKGGRCRRLRVRRVLFEVLFEV